MSIFSEQTTSSALLAYARIIVTGLFLSSVCERAFFWVKHGASTLSRLLVDCALQVLCCAQHLHQPQRKESKRFGFKHQGVTAFQDRSESALMLQRRHNVLYLQRSQKASLICRVSLQATSKPQPRCVNMFVPCYHLIKMKYAHHKLALLINTDQIRNRHNFAGASLVMSIFGCFSHEPEEKRQMELRNSMLQAFHISWKTVLKLNIKITQQEQQIMGRGRQLEREN